MIANIADRAGGADPPLHHVSGDGRCGIRRRGHKAFSLTPEFASASKMLAANQGLYNGFLAAGLIWGLYLGEAGFQIKAFFLICVVIAGLYGARRSAARSCSSRPCRRWLALIALGLGW